MGLQAAALTTNARPSSALAGKSFLCMDVINLIFYFDIFAVIFIGKFLTIEMTTKFYTRKTLF